MNTFAPVLIPTLNRFDKLKNCIASLAACTHADQTELIIALDYPANPAHFEGYQLITSFLSTIKGFKNVRVIQREKNWGVPLNAFGGIETVFQQYDRLIFSEDDNVFAPSFLDYMNKCLTAFKDNPKVATICGYKFPFDVPDDYPHNYFYSKAFSGWGFGMWREKFVDSIYKKDTEKALKNVSSFLKNPINAYRINHMPYGTLEGLMQIVKTRRFTGDRMNCFYNFVQDTYSVFPRISLVRNTGHDGSGAHSTAMSVENNPFINQKIDSSLYFNFTHHVEYNSTIIKKAEKKHVISYGNLKLHHRVIMNLKYLLFLFKNH